VPASRSSRQSAAGLALAPSSYQLGQNAAYLAQEWAQGALQSSGIDGFREAAVQAKDSLPDQADVSKAITGVLFAFLKEQVDRGAFETVVGSIDAAGPALSDEDKQDLYEFAFDTWAKQAIDRTDWEAALAIYDQGLTRAPESSLLKHNREFTLSKL